MEILYQNLLAFDRYDLIMIGIGCLLIYLAIAKEMEPSLLLPMGFGTILVNIPFSDALVGPIHELYSAGIANELFPLLLFIGNRNGGRAVSSTDNCDREEIPEIGEEHTCHAQSNENTKLRSCAKEHQFGVGQQRAKIDHGADADEQQQREQFVCNTGMVQLLNRSDQSVGERNVYKDGAKAPRQ